jgi:hypothetical protein
MVGGRALLTPSYPNWQRNWTQNPDSVGSNPTEGTIVMSQNIGMALKPHWGPELNSLRGAPDVIDVVGAHDRNGFHGAVRLAIRDCTRFGPDANGGVSGDATACQREPFHGASRALTIAITFGFSRGTVMCW